MRGRATFKRRVIEPDNVYGSVLVSKFINRMMKDGKKSTAEKVFYDALNAVSEKKEEALEAFEKAVQNVGAKQENKKKKNRKKKTSPTYRRIKRDKKKKKKQKIKIFFFFFFFLALRFVLLFQKLPKLLL